MIYDVDNGFLNGTIDQLLFRNIPIRDSTQPHTCPPPTTVVL